MLKDSSLRQAAAVCKMALAYSCLCSTAHAEYPTLCTLPPDSWNVRAILPSHDLNSRLEWALLAELRESAEPTGAGSGARSARPESDSVHGELEVVLVVTADASDRRPELEARGATVLGAYGALVHCLIPPGLLPGLLSDESIGWARFPCQPIPCVVTEGVSLTNAAQWHAQGIRGDGVTIAVIDVGFVGLDEALAAQELPVDLDTLDLTGNGMHSSTSHGVAVAEIVHDMAPGAHLVLINTANEVDLGLAAQFCMDNGIHVINHSVGYANTGGYDGTGFVCDIANSTAESNIVWINAAGNHALNHYRRVFTDDDADGRHEFDQVTSDEVNAIGYLQVGMPVTMYLSWNDWPTTAQDYDLYLYVYTDRWTPVDSSCTVQSGAQPPTEQIRGFHASIEGWHGVGVVRRNASRAADLTLFSAYQSMEFTTPAGSILSPADATGSEAVGAIFKDNWTSGPQELSSSQGPTYDGRMKPDICGPDGVVTWTTGQGFWGTSASSPHVAGAAALVWSLHPEWTGQQIRDWLHANAIDMGPAGPDSVYGWGRLNFPAVVAVEDPAMPLEPMLVLSVTPNPSRGRPCITYRVSCGAQVTIDLWDIQGRRVGDLGSSLRTAGTYVVEWTGRPERVSRLGSGVYFVRATAAGRSATIPLVVAR